MSRPDVKLYVESGGSAQAGPPLVFIHGWAGSSRDWRKLVALLPPDQAWLVYDGAGFGRSQFDSPEKAAQADYSLERYVEDLRAVLDEAGYDRVHLIGHSWGGVVGMAFAARYPDRVDRLVAIGSAYFDPDKLLHQILKWASFLIAWLLVLLKKPLARSAQLRRWSVRRYFKHQPDPVTLDELMDEVLQADRHAIIETLLAGYRVQFKTLCPAITCPTLYLGCRQDVVAPPAYVRPFVPITPNATSYIMESCGHFPMLEQPAELLRILAANQTDSL